MSKKGDIDNKVHKFLLVTLILLFFFTLFISISYIIKYTKESSLHKNGEIIEIKTEKINSTIINNGIIESIINKESFKDKNEIVLENINIIELKPNTKDNGKIKYDVKYNIYINDFKQNVISTRKSEVLVRFSYSFDNENWIYTNNVITTNTSNISPLIGNNYDISGITTNLNIATNQELSTTNNKATKMYWRSETIFKNNDDFEGNKNFKANFTIEYKTS